MTNEENTTPEETTSRINDLTAKLKSLPWKKIAIGAAVTTAAAVAVTLAKNSSEPAYEIEITEATPEGELSVDLTPIND